MHTPSSAPDIRTLIEHRDWKRLRAVLEARPAPDTADGLGELTKIERALAFRALSRHFAADVFSHLSREDQDTLLAELTDAETRALLAGLQPDDRAALLGELPAVVTRRLINLLSPHDLEESRFLLGFPPKSVGRLMVPDYVAVDPEASVGDTITYLRRFDPANQTLDRIYVVDRAGELIAEVALRQLLFAAPDTEVHRIADRAVVSVQARDDREEAVRLMQRYDLPSLPVVGSDGHLLGVVTFDDVADVADEEVTEDIFKQAGVTYEDGEASRSRTLLHAPLAKAVWLRIPWLMVALVGGLLAAVVMGAYEESLEAVVALAFFVPLVMDMGGNVGTQASTIFVRGLSIGQIDPKNIRHHLLRELVIGLAIGVIVGAISGVIAVLWQGIFELGLVIFLSMVGVCTIAALVGYGVPWVAQRVGVDPATVSDPFITTIKDVTALLIYFSLASLLMGAMMPG